LLKLRSSKFIVIFFCLAGGLRADGPKFWTTQTQNDYLKGQSEEISILAEEGLVLASGLKLLTDTGEPFIWDLASGTNGLIYIGTGHDGRVLSITPRADTATVYDALEPEVTALAVNRKGDLFVGASPEGRVYRIPGGKGTAEVFFDPEEKYIWSLAFNPKGDLYVAAGSKGRLYKVTADRESRLILDTEEQHIISLAFDLEGNLLAGSSGSAILYQIDPKDNVSILYDSSLKDIRSIVVDSRNNLYVAAFELQSLEDISKMMVPQPEGAADKPSNGEPSKEEDESSKQPKQIVLRMPPPTRGIKANSEIYMLDKDRFVTRIWRGNGESVMAIGIDRDDRALFVSTKEKSTLNAINQYGELTLISSFKESEVSGFLGAGGRILFCTSNVGKIYELEQGFSRRGSFTSEVLLAGLPAEWGSISWEGETPPGTEIYFQTRSGNTARPDTTWSAWSAPYRGKPDEKVSSPPRQYFQWEAVLSTNNSQVTPKLTKVTVSYLRRNRPPMISPIRFMPQGMYVKSSPSPSDNSSGNKDYPYAVDQLLENKKSGSTENPFQGKKDYSKGLRMAGWNANDPNGDQLLYHVHYRGINESTWKPLALGTADNSITFNTETMADGKYVIKVTACDSLDNPDERALTAERVSPLFVVDNTAPFVKNLDLSKSASGTSITISFQARDEMSRIERAEISLDAADWKKIFPVDRIADSRSEDFSITFDKVPPGDHTVSVQVYDEFYNTTTVSRTIKLP